MRGRRALAVAVLAGVALAAGASARGAGITRTWLAASDGNFSDGGNWSGTTAPGSDDTAIFDKTGTYKVTFTDTAGNAVTSLLRVSAGDVTFDLKPGSTSHTYTLGSTAGTTISGTLVGNVANQAATLNVSGGTLAGVNATIGNVANATGTVSLSGTGSSWHLSSFVYIGYGGDGTLSVGDTASALIDATIYMGRSDGASGLLQVSGGGTLSSTTTYMGYSGMATATATIDGAGSKWTNTGLLEVGRGGTGTLEVTHGGNVADSSNIYISFSAGSMGHITVDGADPVSGALSTLSGTNFYGGYAGSGTLDIKNGGTMTTTSSYLGYGAGTAVTGTVDGTDSKGHASTWNTTSLTVGNNGDGTLNVTAGGLVSAGGTVNIASGDGSSGLINVTGANSILEGTNNINVGGSSSAGGTGVLSVGQGGLVTTGNANAVKVYSPGTVKFQGNGTVTTATFQVTGGAVEVSHLNNTINGNLTLDSSSTLQMTLDGTDDYGQLGGSGTLTAGGLFKVVLGDFTPVAGNTFHVLNWKTISGTFATVDLQPLSGGLSWDQGGLYSTGYITVAPEPGMLGMLAAGGMMLAVRRRRGTLRQT
jgi:T5SS/PEP-CTERM-associated repeat protein